MKRNEKSLMKQQPSSDKRQRSHEKKKVKSSFNQAKNLMPYDEVVIDKPLSREGSPVKKEIENSPPKLVKEEVIKSGPAPAA